MMTATIMNSADNYNFRNDATYRALMTMKTKTMLNTMTITTMMSTLAKDDNSDDIDEAND